MRNETLEPEDYTEQRLAEEGFDFRCQRGQHRHPKSDLHIEPHSNLRVCSFHLYSPNRVETALIFADAAEEAAQITEKYASMLAADKARGLPIPSLFVGMQSITTASPAQPSLQKGGAGVVLTLVGVGFTTDDLITFDDAAITATAPVVTFGGTQLVTTLTASGSAGLGLHTMRLNDWQTGVQVLVHG